MKDHPTRWSFFCQLCIIFNSNLLPIIIEPEWIAKLVLGDPKETLVSGDAKLVLGDPRGTLVSGDAKLGLGDPIERPDMRRSMISSLLSTMNSDRRSSWRKAIPTFSPPHGCWTALSTTCRTISPNAALTSTCRHWAVSFSSILTAKWKSASATASEICWKVHRKRYSLQPLGGINYVNSKSAEVVGIAVSRLRPVSLRNTVRAT